MKQLRCIIASLAILGSTTLWSSPALSDPPLPRIDWQELEDFLGDDPDSDVGEEMC